MSAPPRLLFVCLGNICRSPSAEGVVRARAAEAGIAVVTDSAGTGDWHVGSPPYGPMIDAAAARGIDISDLRARQVTATDFTDFDLILAMDDDNLANVERLRPYGSETPVKLFMDYAPEAGTRVVPDPYYTRDFDGALDLIEQAAAGVLDAVAGGRAFT